MNSFSDFTTLGVAPAVLKALKDIGYEQPSPIQQQSIPLLLNGGNLLGVAQTGTGKTAAFALPLISRLKQEQRSPQILVLTPTRELSIQVAEAFKSYSRYLQQFHVLPVYGGQDMRGQLRALKRGVQVVVGTPGRIMDHMRRGSLNLSEIKAVVLDEADEMLRMGFIDDVETILSDTPKNSQRALFSATMPPAIKKVANKYLGDAEEVRIATKTTTVEQVEQHYLLVHPGQKLDALTRILEVENFDAMIVFVRTKAGTVELTEKLEARGFAANALHGDLSQQLRERTIDRLKRGKLDILVATDVAARGLDVGRISHVFNYDIPYDTEAYVHRIGRTGRAGREGKAILFIIPKEKRLLKAIEKATRQPLSAMELPSNDKISEQRIQQFQQQLLTTLETEKLSDIRSLLENLALAKELDAMEIAAALAYQQQQENPLFPVFKELPKPPTHNKTRNSAKAKNGRRNTIQHDNDPPMDRYRIAVGRKQNISPKDIVGAIANEAQIDSRYIGRIELHENYSTVMLPKGMPKNVFKNLKAIRIRQHPAQVQLISQSASKRKHQRKRAVA